MNEKNHFFLQLYNSAILKNNLIHIKSITHIKTFNTFFYINRKIFSINTSRIFNISIYVNNYNKLTTFYSG